MTADRTDDRRNGHDRRRKPTTIWDAVLCHGQRAFVRREPERWRPHYVDRFPASTFVWIMLLLACTVLDGWLTLELVEAGYHEVNPVMHFLLAKGPAHFLIGKYILAAAGLPILVLFGNCTRFRHAVPIFVVLYIALISYQLTMLHQLRTAAG